MKHQLIIFDIDGTLTNTNHIDALCFEKAIIEVLSLPSINTNFAQLISIRLLMDNDFLKLKYNLYVFIS